MSFDNSIAYTISTQGTSTDVDDYMSRLEDFLLVSCGFTLIADRVDDPEIGSDYKVFTKNGFFYHFQSQYATQQYPEIEANIYVHINKQYNSSLPFFDQPNTPIYRDGPFQDATMGIPFLDSIGTPRYYFFWNGRNLYIINEFKIGLYTHLSVGESINYGTKENYYITSTSNGVKSESELENDYRALYINTERRYNLYIDDILQDIDDTKTDGGNSYPIPCFNDQMKQSSFISTEYKGLLFSPSYYENLDGQLFKPLTKHSDNFLCYTDWFIDLEEYYIGIKKYKFFPFYQKLIPADINSDGKGCGIVLRIE